MNDNIIHGFAGWAQPYRFVIMRHTKWDRSQVDSKSIHVVDDPADAYAIFMKLKANDQQTMREVLFEWMLVDSFGKDALEFCKHKAEHPISSRQAKEKNG